MRSNESALAVSASDPISAGLHDRDTGSVDSESEASVRAELDAVGGALALSAHVLVAYPRQISSQLAGRLLEAEAPALARFRSAVVEQTVLLPLLPGLTAPGGPLVGVVPARQIASVGPLGGTSHVVVRSIAVGLDGRTVAVGYEDGQVHALDLESRIRLWARHYDPDIMSLAVDPRRGLIVSGSADGTLRILDPASGDDLGPLGRHDGAVLRVAVSPYGRLVVSGSLDGSMRVWDLDDRRETGRLPGPGPFALAPDGRLFAVSDGDLSVYDLEALLGTLVVADQRHVLAMAVTPDGGQLVTLCHEEGTMAEEPDTSLNRVLLTVHDVSEDEEPLTGTYIEPATGIHQFNWAALGIAPDSTFAVSGSLTGKVLFWDLARVAHPALLSGHITQVLAVAVTPDARRVLTGSRDGTVRIWDPARVDRPARVAAHPGEVNGIAVTPDGLRAVTVASDGSVAVWDLVPERAGRGVPWSAGACWSVAVSDDGARAVIGGSNGLVAVLDLESGAEIARLTLPGGDVMQVDCSSTADQVWAVATDGTSARWDLHSGTTLEEPAPTGGTPLFGLATTPDGGRTLAGTADGSVKIIDRADPHSAHTLGQHRARVRSAAMTPDGRLAITGDADGDMMVWDLQRLEPVYSMAAHDGIVMALAITPDGRLAASAGWDSEVVLWDLQTGTAIESFSGEGRLISIALSANGMVCVAGEQSGRIHALLLNLPGRPSETAPSTGEDADGVRAEPEVSLETARAAGTRCEQLLAGDPGNAEHAESLALAYGNLASLLGGEGRAEWLGYAIRCRDLLRGLQADAVPLAPVALEWLGAMEGVLTKMAESIGHEFDHLAIAVDSLQDDEPSGPVLEHGIGPVLAVAAAPGRDLIVSAGADGTARMWEPDSVVETQTLAGHDAAIMAVAVSSDGRLVVSGSFDCTIRVWDAASGADLHLLRGHEGEVFAVAVTPDGKHVISGSADATVRVWDLASGSLEHTWRGHEASVMAVAVTADGSRVVSGSEDGTLRLWNVDTGESRVLAGHEGQVLAVALVPGDDRVISGSFDQTIKIWDLESGVAIATLAGHYDAVRAVVVTPDGRRFASAFFDGSIRIWDLRWCAEVATLTGHDDAVTALALLRDGRRLVSGSNDGTVLIWDLLLQGGGADVGRVGALRPRVPEPRRG